MKKIIIIRNAYAHDFGGGERFPVFLAESLKKCNFEPILVSRHHTLNAFATSHDILTIRSWWWMRQNWSGWRIALLPFYLMWQLVLFGYYVNLFIRLKPAVVHIQSKDDFIAATYAGRLVGARVIWTDHADLKHIWKNLAIWHKNPIGKLVYLAAHLAKTITVVSKSEQHEVYAHLTNNSSIRDKIAVVYNGCADVLSVYPPRQQDNTTVFVIASRLVTDKGIGEAIDAFISVYRDNKNTRLVIAGDGPEREKFAAKAKMSSAITLLGYQADPYTAMRQGDVFLQPTYHEGFSVALVEASMLALPIIATNVGGNVEIIDDHRTGLLVPPKNVEALAEAMNLLLNDTRLRSRLAQAARLEYERNFIFDRIVLERFIPLYEATN